MQSQPSDAAVRGQFRSLDDLPSVPVTITQGADTYIRRDRPTLRGSGALADLAYIALTTTGWLAGNLLGILGCAVAMFIVISHGHVDTFFLHVDNLASRYVAADLGRREVFEQQLVQVFVIVLGLTLAVRGPLFVRRVRRELREGKAA